MLMNDRFILRDRRRAHEFLWATPQPGLHQTLPKVFHDPTPATSSHAPVGRKTPLGSLLRRRPATVPQRRRTDSAKRRRLPRCASGTR
jgi:hypothetical protein